LRRYNGAGMVSLRQKGKRTMTTDTSLQPAGVRSLCEKYLQQEPKAVLLLNTIISHAADMAMIDEQRESDDAFDYHKELQELIHMMKDMIVDLDSNDLLILGFYAK
jgi:hypothetical protein